MTTTPPPVPMMTPAEFVKLTQDEQAAAFETAKNLANYREKTIRTHFYCDEQSASCKHEYYHVYAKSIVRGFLHRPFKMNKLPQGWDKIYAASFEREYPDGEELMFHDPEMNATNYSMLYHWIQGHCMKCQRNGLVWEEGDKHVEYLCIHCHDETPFFKHWRAYY
jgi:hypothetical protein